MTINGWVQILIYFVLLTALTRPLGGFLYRVFEGQNTWLSRVLGPLERGFYKLAGVDAKAEQHWTSYTLAMLVFNLVCFVTLFFLQLWQNHLPLNPQGQSGLTADLAFNTAISFVTNTNWQNYGGETTMSYLTQMLGLTVHNFVSAATGIALAVALVRGFSRRSGKTIGNFWVDLTRGTLYVLLPISIVAALFLVWQGMPQNLHGYTAVATLEGAKQTIAQGPVASQIAIKMLGTNGGGFFNANAAHPFENPTALSDFFQILLIFAIPAALTNLLGRMVKNELQGWAIYSAMSVLFFVGVTTCYWAEAQGNPQFAALGIDQQASALQSGGNMEGKETRFGVARSALFATITTDASCGAVNSWHDSFTPLGGMVPLTNILLGEVIFGGVGAGLYGMLAFAILAVFIAGLMVGRTPEYLGKKIESKEVKMTMLALLCLPLANVGMTALAAVLPQGLAGLSNAGPHGFSELFYAYASATGNNGSAFGGLSGNTPFYNITLALSMMIGRFAFIVPMMAVAGSLAAKKYTPASAGTFPTHGGLFISLLVGVVLIVGGLTYFPALALGPIVEHYSMAAGNLY